MGVGRTERHVRDRHGERNGVRDIEAGHERVVVEGDSDARRAGAGAAPRSEQCCGRRRDRARGKELGDESAVPDETPHRPLAAEPRARGSARGFSSQNRRRAAPAFAGPRRPTRRRPRLGGESSKSARAGAARSPRSGLSETGEIVQEPKVIGPRSATNALPATNTARDEAADAPAPERNRREPGYDAVADFSDCPAGLNSARREAALLGTPSRTSRTPLPANPTTHPRRATRSPRPRPRLRPGAGGAARTGGGARAARN